jgi:hypothetical protein
MFAALIASLGGKLLLPIAFLAAGGVVFLLVRHELDARAEAEARAAVQSQQLDQAHAINQANAAALVELKADSQRQMAALAADHAASLLRNTKIQTIQKEIADAPPSDDAPVAPVLRRALERLRLKPGAAAPLH